MHPTRLLQWFDQKGWRAYDFQRACWEAVLHGQSGLLNAPTGFGKTYALFLPLLLQLLEAGKTQSQCQLRMIWITPLRALTADLEKAMQEAALSLGLKIRIESRTGDTDVGTKQRQRQALPEVLLTTPESLNLLLSRPGWESQLDTLSLVVVDEWHELLGNKRGVLMELALAVLKHKLPALQLWGISATIGNMDEALAVLHGERANEAILIKSTEQKRLQIETIIPEAIEHFPWAGHLGLKMLDQLIPLLHQAKTTLIFTNTRGQAEIWYQRLLEREPALAGLLAIHHGSLDQEIRAWVENALHAGKLRAVVCTSSLDLGVDFRPVEQVIQIGSPKGVARFMQRAGRSGHQPGALSTIYLAPTHALELLESAALKAAIEAGQFEAREPIVLAYDVLLQFMMTLACGGGFTPDELFATIKTSFAYQELDREAFDWCVNFLLQGGKSLEAYDEYKKAGLIQGKVLPANRSVALRHRMSIGTIVGDTNLMIEFMNGTRLGQIEEYFISSLKPGDHFWFAGRALEFVRIREMKVQVRKSSAPQGKVPSWMGGRMPLSSQLSAYMREKCDLASQGLLEGIEMESLEGLLHRQAHASAIPSRDELLIEYVQSQEGFHLFVFLFEGRLVHEGMAALFAYRIAKRRPISFSIAMNDYGFELLSDQEIPLHEALLRELCSTANLRTDILQSLNATEMARRQFGEICRVAGLVFQGFPGAPIRTKHLKASSHLLFDVFYEYEPDNLLIQQALDQALHLQLDESRLRLALKRIESQNLLIRYLDKPTPFCFPIMADRLREKMSSESLADRLKKMVDAAVTD